MTEEAPEFVEERTNTLDEDDDSIDSGDILFMELPKKLLEHGKFIGSNLLNKDLLWSPPRELKLPFSNIWRLGSSLWWSIIPGRSQMGNPHESKLQQYRSKPVEDEDDDVESQFHSIAFQGDGIYVPSLRSSQGVVDGADISYEDRVSSRLERDRISMDRSQTEFRENLQNHTFEYLRPENVQRESRHSPSNDKDEIGTNIEQGACHCLLIDLERIKLSNHPDLLEEEILVRKIELICGKLKTLNDNEKMKIYEIRLNSIINEVIRYKRLESNDSENKYDIDCETDEGICLILYQEILTLASNMVELEFKAYSLYDTILKKWERILRVREIQGFQSTTVSLLKSLREGDDLISKQLNRFQKHMKWFAQKVIASSGTSDSVTYNLQNTLDTLAIILSNRNRRMDIVLCKNDEISLTNSSNHIHERKRRERIRSDRYYAKLFIDGKLVGATKTVQLEWPKLELSFHKQFKIFLDYYPDAVSINIHRARFLRNDHLICTIYINVPGDKYDFSDLSLELLSPSKERYTFSEASNYSIVGGNRYRNLVEGYALISSQWKKDEEYSIYSQKHPDCNVIKPKFITYDQAYIGNEQYRERERQMPPDTLGERINDEELETITPSIRAALNDASMRFTVTGTKHSFLNSSLLKEPVRHQLVKQRNNHHEFSPWNNFKIPLLDSDVNDEAAQLVADSRIRSRIENDLVEAASEERIAVDRKNIKYFVKQLRVSKRNFHKWKNPSQVAFEDIIHDASLIRGQAPSIDLSWVWSKIYPPRKRSLFPGGTTDVKKVDGNLSAIQKGRLIITVVGGNNVQRREDRRLQVVNHDLFLTSPPSIKRMSSEMFSSSPKPDSFRIKRDEAEMINTKKNVHPFTRIQFQDKIFYTRVDSGDCPLWDQVVELSLFSEDMDKGFTPLKLKELDATIDITLFDQVELDYGRGGGYYDDEETVVQESRYLGHLRIPLDNLAHDEGQVHGNYILHTPEVILGYNGQSDEGLLKDNLTSRHVTENSDIDDLESHEGTTKFSFTSLKLFISVEPMFSSAPQCPLDKSFPSNEEPSTVRYAKHWMNEYANFNLFCAKRYSDVLIPGLNGKTWLINRFLHSQAPPKSCELSMHRCAHFVSIIPFLKNWDAFKSLKHAHNIWSSSQTFLDILAGNWPEHAILLANYFLFLSNRGPDSCKVDVYLAIGSSITEKRVVYVLTRTLRDRKITLWNPATGQSFAYDDAKCPLINVGLVVSPRNIFANLQCVGQPCLLNFELHCKKAWKPFYHQPAPTPALVTATIQDPVLQYTSPKQSLATELEVDLLDKVKTSIRSWRRTSCRFNSDIGNRLRCFLEEIEENKRNGTPQKHPDEYTISLNGICRGKSLFGFPLHFGFSNMDEILERVKMTSIHKSKHPDVEFATAVKIFPYECGVLSVWVFICTLCPDHFV